MIGIFYGKNATSMELLACKDLKKDLEGTTNLDVKIQKISQPFPNFTFKIIVGAPKTNFFIQRIADHNKIPISKQHPGKRGGCISIITEGENKDCIVLAGSDAQGAQYAVYDFSRRELGIDPFNFWTGYSPSKINFSLELVKERVIAAPVVPILCYFDNDNDELANMTKPYLEFSFEHWKELIDTLVRLKYNAIDIHDHLGRIEFYKRKPYNELRPDYKTNLDLLETVINYAHKKGMMVQIPMYLGWQFHPISERARKNWPKYKQEWINTWQYYLSETPLGKGDIFYNRPRDQKWDRAYKGKGDPAVVFNEAFSIMYVIVKNHNPDAIIVYDLYMSGMDLFKKGFSPSPAGDIILAWPNNGFGKIESFPEDKKGHPFGVYVHAGYYLNHVVQDPYPGVLAHSMKKAFLEHNMTHYCLVNGQTFRHFILNLEAASLLSNSPKSFDPEDFYLKWASRYFGEKVKKEVVKVLKMLHAAQKNELGYTKLLYNIKTVTLALRLMHYLFIVPNSLIRKLVIKFGKIGKEYTLSLNQNIKILIDALTLSQKISSQVKDQQHLFHDLVILQIKLLLQLNQIAYNLQLVLFDYKDKSPLKKAIHFIDHHTETRLKGDKNSKWATWYNPQKARPNGGYPSIKKLKKLL